MAAGAAAISMDDWIEHYNRRFKQHMTRFNDTNSSKEYYEAIWYLEKMIKWSMVNIRKKHC